MTNGEKFKTAEEREKQYKKYCSSHGIGCSKCPLKKFSSTRCPYEWLDLQYTEVEVLLKPCPLCGCTEVRVRKINDQDIWYISCNRCGCSTDSYTIKDLVIEAWNRRVK